jgi:4-amino-4-deoxy-L-arabinose transferase-like glycosyltransferase
LLPDAWVRPALAALLAAALASRLLWLDTPPIPVFDEGLFYIPAAQAYLAGQPDPNFEHPPLGKLIFAAGLGLFGDTPWGWRLLSALAGVAGIGFTYLLGASLWRSRRLGLLAAGLLALDLLWLLFSRLMMYDIFLATLVLAALTLSWRYRASGNGWTLAGAGLAVGLAAAVKWSGLWALAPMALALAAAPGATGSVAAVLRRAALLAGCAAVGYLIPWLYHFVVLGYGPAEFLERHARMLAYQVSIAAPPDPGEQWRTPLRWLLNLPLPFTSRDDRSVWVLSMSNPLVFWGGIAATGWLAWTAARIRPLRRALASPHAFLLTWMLVYYLPWFGFPRVKYFYYLLPLLPAFAIAVAGALRALAATDTLGPTRWRRLAIAGYLAGAAAAFVGFYPGVAGLWSGPP